ncbi:hypothetical protein A0H81_04664 [Grifola frondosa]|uniref:Uncharacterized protein n=1 Tax=Grifola frondosa TaxID=5627 RepID=A0A1C7MEM8_GRIFR|nr:hypothetical protein A0H81_04664 [Grifola frondosa]
MGRVLLVVISRNMGPMNPGDMAFEGALIQANVLVLYGSLAVVGRSRICSFSISRDCDRSSSYDAEHSGWWHFTNAIFNTHLTLNALSHTGFPHVIHNVPRDEGLADLKNLLEELITLLARLLWGSRLLWCDVAVQAMTTVHLYQGRRWRGWYNSPGSYEIAKQYGRLAASRFWDGLYPGPNVDPAVLFGLDGQAGPQYVAAHSGTVMPQTVSFVTSWTCCYFRDWFCGFMILLGIISSGLSCLVLGSGKFTFTHPNPAKGAPNGNGHGQLAHEGAFLSKFLAQLLLIPQGTLFGQIMFLSSLAASWIYNCYLASLDTEQVQSTSAVVLVTLVLKPINVEDQLEQLLPNKTHVWRKWRETVARKIVNSEPFVFDQMDFAGIADDELLRTLYGDATMGYRSYLQHQRMQMIVPNALDPQTTRLLSSEHHEATWNVYFDKWHKKH